MYKICSLNAKALKRGHLRNKEDQSSQRKVVLLVKQVYCLPGLHEGFAINPQPNVVANFQPLLGTVSSLETGVCFRLSLRFLCSCSFASAQSPHDDPSFGLYSSFKVHSIRVCGNPQHGQKRDRKMRKRSCSTVNGCVDGFKMKAGRLSAKWLR